MPAVADRLGTAIYGAITVGALLAAESAQRETYGATVAAVAVATILYWLAHAYAEVVSWRVRESRRLTMGGLRRALLNEAPIMVGGVIPLLAVLVEWVAGASLDTAVVAALWADVVTIVVAEVIVAVRANLTGRELIVQSLVGALLGLLIIGLRLVLH
jgi:hypothetical protein